MSAAERYALAVELFGEPAPPIDPIELDDDEESEPQAYDAIAEAVRLARHGLMLTPFVLTVVTKADGTVSRNKTPALPGSWAESATDRVSDVVQDFEFAVSKYGNDRVLVAWALGLNGFCAMDDDYGLPDTVKVVRETPHAVNKTHRGEHLIWRFPENLIPGNSTDRFPDADFGEFRGRKGILIVAGIDRPGFDPAQLEHAQPFPFPEWLKAYEDSAPPADDQTVVAFLADHDQRIDTDRLDHVVHQLDDDETPSRHGRLIKYAGWLMRDARAGIVTAVEARAALWTWWENSGVRDDYPRTWQTDFHRYIACAIGYANAEPDSVMVERLNKAKTWEPLEGVDEHHADASPCTLTEAHTVARRWLGDEYDLDALDVALAAAAVEQLTGDPIWLLIISGSGNAKTETVQAFGAAGAHVTSTITSVGALLSASPRKEKAKDATGGLLRKVGDSGIIVIKDVTSILSMDRNGRAEVLAALREVYDGRWERNVGTDGGRTLTWAGRIVVIGAVTTAWDRAHDVISAMGDRFVLLRMDSTEGRMQAGRRSIGNTGAEVQMRGELADAVAGVLTAVDPSTAVDLTDDETERLLAAADIVTIGRTAVDYDYRGDVIDSHAPEMPTRFAKQLAQVVRGAVAIGIDRVDALRLAVRCARDSMPPLRLAILLDVAAHPGSTTTEVRRRIDKPRATVDRQLQSLHMLGLLDCTENESYSGHGIQWRYSVSDGFNADALNPETVTRNVTNYTQGHEKERSERPFATTHLSGDGPDDGVF